jgi:hypothetical protein
VNNSPDVIISFDNPKIVRAYDRSKKNIERRINRRIGVINIRITTSSRKEFSKITNRMRIIPVKTSKKIPARNTKNVKNYSFLYSK